MQFHNEYGSPRFAILDIHNGTTRIVDSMGSPKPTFHSAWTGIASPSQRHQKYLKYKNESIKIKPLEPTKSVVDILNDSGLQHFLPPRCQSEAKFIKASPKRSDA